MHGRLGRPASAPLKVTVDNVVTMDLQENLRGIERQIEQVRQAAAPDEPSDDDERARPWRSRGWCRRATIGRSCCERLTDAARSSRTAPGTEPPKARRRHAGQAVRAAPCGHTTSTGRPASRASRTVSAVPPTPDGGSPFHTAPGRLERAEPGARAAAGQHVLSGVGVGGRSLAPGELVQHRGAGRIDSVGSRVLQHLHQVRGRVDGAKARDPQGRAHSHRLNTARIQAAYTWCV